MKRVLSACAVLIAAATFLVMGQGAGDSSEHYKVRAIFRNAFSVIKGEDVKIAGVKVGSIDSIGVTEDQKAYVVLDITKPGFDNWKSNATCTIRPQSLIGEKFVECTPTEAGSNEQQSLQKIPDGKPGAGQYLLPVSQTARPVDIDLVNNILRLPYRQRLSILLNEFGAGLAGRGEDLRDVIRNADPGLKETDRVLEILAKQNTVLAKLATDSDTIMQPLARDRAKVADFIEQANTVNEATAEKRDAFEENLQKLPEFLRQLRPTMAKLGALSDQATPVLNDLGAQAPSINRLIQQLGPFAAASTPSIKSLGEATVPGREALKKAEPIVSDLKEFASQAKPLTTNLRDTLKSIKDTGGVERLMDYIFYQVAAVNGFDAYGHYLRAQLVVNLCSTYATTADPACSAKFVKAGTRSTARAALDAPGRDPQLAAADAVLRGMSPKDIKGRDDDKVTKKDTTDEEPVLSLPTVLPGSPATEGEPVANRPAPTVATPEQTNAVQGLLDYLLGGPGQ